MQRCFQQVRYFKKSFPVVPIIATTATLPLYQVEKLGRDMLREPLLIRGSVDRPNINIRLMDKNRPKGKGNVWNNVAEQIKTMILDNVAIVYCSFVKTCDLLCSALLEKDIAASAYTGASHTAEEKKTFISL